MSSWHIRKRLPFVLVFSSALSAQRRCSSTIDYTFIERLSFPKLNSGFKVGREFRIKYFLIPAIILAISEATIGTKASRVTKMGDGMTPTPRLSLATLDPRTLFPTQENVLLVTNCIQSVQVQLEQDRLRLKQGPDNQQAREFRNESVQYMALLNDWIGSARTVLQQPQQQRPRFSSPSAGVGRAAGAGSSQYGVVMEPAEEADFRVLASSQHPPETRRCLWDKVRGLHYVQIKKLRDTIYGSVKLYQIGRM
jgi:hypothetical protein